MGGITNRSGARYQIYTCHFSWPPTQFQDTLLKAHTFLLHHLFYTKNKNITKIYAAFGKASRKIPR